MVSVSYLFIFTYMNGLRYGVVLCDVWAGYYIIHGSE